VADELTVEEQQLIDELQAEPVKRARF